jgi:hypothetical protein
MTPTVDLRGALIEKAGVIPREARDVQATPIRDEEEYPDGIR